MIDKRKVALIGLALGVVLGLLIAGIVWVASNTGTPQSSDDTDATPDDASRSIESSPTETDSTTDEPEVSLEVDQSYVQTAIDAAVASATWSGFSTDEQRRSAYREAGFSDQLVKTFEPIWQEVFDVPQVLRSENSFDGREVLSAETTATWEGDPSIDATTGEEPNRQFQIAVTITYTAIWDHKQGSDDIRSQGEATWVITVDEATGKAVAVKQPQHLIGMVEAVMSQQNN